MLNVIVLNVIMLNVVMLSVACYLHVDMLNVIMSGVMMNLVILTLCLWFSQEAKVNTTAATVSVACIFAFLRFVSIQLYF